MILKSFEQESMILCIVEKAVENNHQHGEICQQ
ncbi:hypothetical protein CY0110_27034 [Crocosphaera chwakensis CCY0110]|uniref:Uncharacterized protein n=1 Tax=Crocosphaera chwakensis CCY0110 TaxID=391612 RepID=A3IVP3_9CHRO|nr:hypothetical protein CY0110_27034 [Crocosphaera chwakensis CCY0110]